MRVLTLIKLQYLSKIVRSRLKKVAIVPCFFTMVGIIKKRFFAKTFNIDFVPEFYIGTPKRLW